MQRALIASGVLGLGTAVVFGAAALTATLFPTGSTVPSTMDWMSTRGGVMMDVGKPIPMPAPMAPGVVVDNEKGFEIDPNEDPGKG